MAYRRQIIIDPHPVLHKVAKKVSALELKLPLTQQLIDDMIETMYAAPGIGLAAPQVGVSKRIFVADIGDEDNPARYVIVNPVVSDFEGEETAVEGCLSIPGKIGDVTRPLKCVVSGLDRHGKKIRVEASDLLARCFQHEVDHLDGILISDKAANMRDVVKPEAGSPEEPKAAKEVSI